MKFKSTLIAIAAISLTGHLKADLVQTIAKIKPSVVILGTYKSTSSPRFSLRGTGFVIGDAHHDSSNLVITNAHVLQQANEADALTTLVIQIKSLNNELQMRTVEVIEVDKIHDLALLRFQGPSAPALNVGDSYAVQEGHAIAFMGFPIGGALGFSPVTHRGTVSSIAAAALPTPSAQQLNEKTIRGLREGSFNIFQLDGTAYPGNSGGPLFDPDTGDVLGVINMVYIKGSRESALSNPSGITYAIPSTFISQLVKRANHSGN
jgi:S1-C subfamily serine protease